MLDFLKIKPILFREGNKMHPLFMHKENRDAYVKSLGYKVRRTSIRNQRLHPHYVDDYPNQDVRNDNGFGNTVYKTMFSVLYGCKNLRA